MKKLIVVVDMFKGLSSTQKSKIKRISSLFSELTFIINAYNPYFERYYFYYDEDFKSVRDNYSIQINEVKKQICSYFDEVNTVTTILECYKKDLVSFLGPEIEGHEDSWILITMPELTNRHTIHLEILRTITCPIIMLTRKGWSKKILITAAIDPVHHNDTDFHVDSLIVSKANQFKKFFDAKLNVVHSCFAPRMIQEHNLRIKKIHNSAIEQFIQKGQTTELQVEIINGNPEESLVKHVDSGGTDLLVMGSRSRDNSNKWFVGSTAESMLKQMPCDILFINVNLSSENKQAN
jgi:nucleotide-binding universal stress UspA family protein